MSDCDEFDLFDPTLISSICASPYNSVLPHTIPRRTFVDLGIFTASPSSASTTSSSSYSSSSIGSQSTGLTTPELEDSTTSVIPWDFNASPQGIRFTPTTTDFGLYLGVSGEGCEVGPERHEELPPRAPTPIPFIWGPHRSVTHRRTGPIQAIPEDESTYLPLRRRVMAFPEQKARKALTPFDILKKGVMCVARAAFSTRSRFVFVS